jgi:type IV pilus assembly protein PilP
MTSAGLMVLLASCGSDGMGDLKQFIADSGKDLRGKVDPLPQVKPYEPVSYNAFELQDPFKPRKLQAKSGKGGGLQPDFNRPREVLESYPLENLKLVGVMEQNRVFHALIKTPDNNLHRVKAGNYAGQNFGMITAISDNEVALSELVQDSAGDWSERKSTLQIVE